MYVCPKFIKIDYNFSVNTGGVILQSWVWPRKIMFRHPCQNIKISFEYADFYAKNLTNFGYCT